MQFLEGIREKFLQLVKDRHLSGEEEIQVVSARPLTPAAVSNSGWPWHGRS